MSESDFNQSESASVSNENVSRILSLLRSGDEQLNLAGSNDVILVLGNTGSGKSTVTQFLAGNNDDLISHEIGVDTDEFIITDTNNRVSFNNTVISKTLIPERVINHETKVVFIDCPGFGDSGRNEAYDIASAYFIKKVLENVKKVKIVLTVSYPSVRIGVNRNDFLQLLVHTSVLIKHIDRYVEGVILIATKVDNTRKVRDNVLVPDSVLIQNMAQFLLEVKESIKSMKTLDQVYKSEMIQVKNELFFESSDKLLNTLLKKNGTEYSRLTIFRRPDAPGRLSQSNLLQDEKKIIENMLNNKIKYVPIDITDIGYAVSDKSKNIINDLATEIEKTIAFNMIRLNDVLIDHFEKLEVEMLDDDMYSLIKVLKNASLAFVQISSIDDSAKAEYLVSRMRENLPEFCKSIAEPYLYDMENLGKFYNFLQDVSEKRFESMAWKWIKELQGAIHYVDNSIKWYNFLAALHQHLSEYDVQKDTKRFHIPKFQSKFGTLENNKNFNKFLNEIGNLNFFKDINFQELLKVNINGLKAQYFEKVVLNTLLDTTCFIINQCQCHPACIKFLCSLELLVVTGEYVKSSQLINHRDFNRCKSVQILAKHTVFVDVDIEKNINISIIAPRWVIIGSRTINLDGSAGPDHVSFKARNGNETDRARNGHDGRPGNPGESAGHFFGIGNEFKNIENLTITAFGGGGGCGQDGGDGACGSDGVPGVSVPTADQGDYKYHLSCSGAQRCFTDITFSKSFLNLEVQTEINHVKCGSAGERGGNAGRGGAPGIGGNAGSVTLFGTGDVIPAAVTKLDRGEDGESGKHGQRGPGGLGGDHRKVSYSFTTWGDPKINIDWMAGKANDGEMGTSYRSDVEDDYNFDGRQPPSLNEFSTQPSFVIADFRRKLMPNLKNAVRKHQALRFFEMLQKKEVIQYDTAELISQELETLKTFSHDQFAPCATDGFLYDLLLERIREKYNTVENVHASEEHELLEALSLAIGSQSLLFEEKSVSRQISDLQAYFDLLKTNDVAKIRQFFILKASDEIKSAEALFALINDDIFDTIESTTNEIVRLSQQHINSELGDQLIKFKLCANLKVISDFLVFCLSLAEAYLDLINTLEVTSTLPSVQLTISAVSGIRISEKLNIIEEAFEKYIDAVQRSISKERMLLKSSGVEYDEICDRFQDADMNLQSCKLLAQKSYQFYPSDCPAANVIQRVHNINNVFLNEANAMARDAANGFRLDFGVIEFSPRLYDALLTRGIDSSSIISCITNSQKNTSVDNGLEEKARHINQTISEIFNTMYPVLHATRSSLIGNLYKPDNLNFLREGISQALSDIKQNFSKLIGQFEIDGHLQLTIENIKDAIDVLISIFNDVLLIHHDRISFRSFYTFLETRTQLENDVQKKLLQMINDDALFYEYKHLFFAYKKIYSSIFDTPTSDIPRVSDSSTAECIVQMLETELNSLEENRPTFTISDYFNSCNKNGPFFTWEGETYKKSISKLLRGKRITMKATDVNKNFDLLQFYDIRLRFKSKDPEVQRSLDETMCNFNVILTHSGRSHFNLRNRIHLINQNSTRFVYKADEAVTEVDDPNVDIVKPSLSPFTTWIFELKSVNENLTFSSLLSFRKTEISMELEGKATYVTKVKPISPDEAREIALSILEQFGNVLKKLAQDESVLLSDWDWDENDTIDLNGQLEKYILSREYCKIIDTLSQSITLDSSREKEVTRQLSQLVNQILDESGLRNADKGQC